MAIRNVVFDVGNVIVKWAPQDIAQLTFGEGEESAFMATAVFKSEFWRDLNKGKYTEAEVKRALHQQLGLSSDTLEQLFSILKIPKFCCPEPCN